MNQNDLGLQDANTREHSNETGNARAPKVSDWTVRMGDSGPDTDLIALIDRLYSACNAAYPWLCKAKASQVEKNTVLPRALDIAISNVQNAAMQARQTLRAYGRQ